MSPSFTIEIPQAARRVLDALEAGGHEAYVVGGCVRDALCGLDPHDWDITTDARPDEVEACLAAAGIPYVETGLQHGTVSAIVEHAPYEVTTFRAEGAYSDCRHPDAVNFIDDVEGDLLRRDFTVNAMAYSPARGLVDTTGGREDLAAGILRTVGRPRERFAEDALRILRALRFSAVRGLSIEADTAAALHADRELLTQVAPERIEMEFRRLICGDFIVDVLLDYADVVSVFIPQIEPCIGFDQRNPHHVYTVWEHMVRAASFAPPQPVMRYAVLFHDIGKPATFRMGEDGCGHFYGHREVGADIFHELARNLRLPHREAHLAELLVRYHDANLPTTKKGLRRWIVHFGEETMRRILAIHRCDIQALNPAEVDAALANMDAYDAFFAETLAGMQVFGLSDLAVDGRDLMDVGVPQGPPVGAALRACLQAVVDGEVPNERDALCAYATR